MPADPNDTSGIPETYRARSIISPAVVKAIAQRISTFRVHPEVAAAAEGVPKTTFRDWMKKADQAIARQEDAGESIFAALAVAVLKASAEAECDLASKGISLAEVGKSTWMAPYRHMESLFRERWQKTEKLEISGQVDHRLDTPPEPAKSLSEWGKRAFEQHSVAVALQSQAVDVEYKERHGTEEPRQAERQTGSGDPAEGLD